MPSDPQAAHPRSFPSPAGLSARGETPMRATWKSAICTLFLLVIWTPWAAAAIAARVDPGAPCFRWPAVDMDEDGVFDRLDNCVDTPRGCAVDPHGCTLDGDADGVCDGIDQCPSTPAGMKVNRQGCHAGSDAMRDTRGQAEPAREIVKAPPSRPGAPRPVSESERQLVESGRIRIENVYFESGRARLLSESEASLKEAGEALEKFPDLEIEVEGHTDSRGSNAYNMRLSQSRAEAVRSYLLSHFRLESAHLKARGYGETRRETRERNEEQLLRNRRVELRVLNPEALPRGVRIERNR
jgi:OmpA-OmpF porin, OOP family